MQWSEFLEKVKLSKKAKIDANLSTTCITSLIFAGAFDSMIDEDVPANGDIKLYTQMYEDAKKALGSKAKMPTKSKIQLIGLDEVKNERQLGLWRFSANPMSKFDFSPYCKEWLARRGFCELSEMKKKAGYHRNFPLYHEETDTFPYAGYLINHWQGIFENDFELVTKAFLDKAYMACLVGVVVSAEKVTMKSGKKRMKVDFYNGYGIIRGLNIWPTWGSDSMPKFTGSLKKMNFGMLVVSVNVYNGHNGGNIVDWMEVIG